jgi:hypothetical protein
MSKAETTSTTGGSEEATFEQFLAKLGARDKLNVERLLAAEATSKRHAEVWRELATYLFKLAGHAVQTSGQQAVRFFLQDGKYRLQCFALEDQQDSFIHVYATDILAAATKKKILVLDKNHDEDDESDVKRYHSVKHPSVHIGIESLTASNSGNAPEHYKHMLGWNRRALRITVPESATPEQIELVQALCVLARENTKS